jgi:hypothetical protein
MKNFRKFATFAVALSGLFVGADALAVPPAYVTDALTAAETTLTEYVGAAAPKVLSAVAIVAALGLIVRMVKRAMSGS